MSLLLKKQRIVSQKSNSQVDVTEIGSTNEWKKPTLSLGMILPVVFHQGIAVCAWEYSSPALTIVHDIQAGADTL